MSKKTFPTISDIAHAILASDISFKTLWYNPHQHIFIICEMIPTRVTCSMEIAFYKKYSPHFRFISFKKGYDIYCKAYSK